MDWTEVLSLSIPLYELVLRGSITYLLLYILMRVVGRRESGSVGITDVLVIVLIANAASTGMAGESQTVTDGMVLVLVILLWSVLIDALSYRFPWLARMMKAGPRTLIDEGKLVRRTMRREFMTYDEVMSHLRLHGIADPVEVQRAYLEPTGNISVVTVEEARKEAEDDPSGEADPTH